MIAVDSNILVYASRAESPWHAAALRTLDSIVENGAPWAIPWPCVHEFLGVVTNPSIYRPATPVGTALDAIDDWLSCPTLALLSEASDHRERLRELVVRGRVAGPAVHDARIAAICLSHGVRELLSADRDFSRFPALRVRNPLV
jgi:hypothetical protein